MYHNSKRTLVYMPCCKLHIVFERGGRLSTPSSVNGLLRRDFLRASAGFTSLAFLVASAPAPSGAPAAGGEAAPSTGTVTITFAGWGGPAEDEGVQAAIKQFESEQDAIKVTWLHTPDTEYRAKLVTNIAAGTPPATAFIGSDYYQDFIKEGQLLYILI